MKKFLKNLLTSCFPKPAKQIRKRKAPPAPRENTHNLAEISQKINNHYFEGKLEIPIHWSKKGTTPGRRSRRLGSYCLRKKRILIDGRLDHPHFPEEFIAFLVYHEMLHSILPPFRLKSGRRAIHHREFREKERAFEGYDEIKRWEKEHSHLFFS